MDVAHNWQPTGITIDTFPSFEEERCAACGAVAWGGSRVGEYIPESCPRDFQAFREWYREAVLAHNRRAPAYRHVLVGIENGMHIWAAEAE